MNIVDFLAILPFYVDIAVGEMRVLTAVGIAVETVFVLICSSCVVDECSVMLVSHVGSALCMSNEAHVHCGLFALAVFMFPGGEYLQKKKIIYRCFQLIVELSYLAVMNNFPSSVTE